MSIFAIQGLVDSTDRGFILSTLKQRALNVKETSYGESYPGLRSNFMLSSLMIKTGTNFMSPFELAAEAEMSLTTAYLRNVREQKMKPKVIFTHFSVHLFAK